MTVNGGVNGKGAQASGGGEITHIFAGGGVKVNRYQKERIIFSLIKAVALERSFHVHVFSQHFRSLGKGMHEFLW